MHKKKKRSRVLVGILCFFLGFLFAFIFQIGAIVGGCWFVATRDIDKMMAFIGVPNDNNKYINTDTENGGSKTIKDLVVNLYGAIQDMNTLCIDKISGLIPATDMLLDKLYAVTDKYIEIDREEFENTPVAELPQFVVDSVMNIRGSMVMSFLPDTGDGGANGILKALLNGAEAEYATVTAEGGSTYAEGDGETQFKLPVLFDVYDKSGETFTRECPVYVNGRPEAGYPTYADNTKPSTDWLQEAGTETDGELEIERYRLYFVPCKVTASGIEEADYSMGEYEYVTSDGKDTYNYKILKFGDDTDFIMVKPDGDGKFVLNYNDIYASRNADSSADASNRYLNYSYKKEYAENYYYVEETKDRSGAISCRFRTLSGLNYFYNCAGEMTDLWVHTLGDIMNNPYEPLESVTVASVTAGSGSLTSKMFGKTSVADLMNGKVDFGKMIDDMELSEFINNVSPTNKLMANLVYKLTDVRDNGDGTYSAIYDIDGERKIAYVTASGGSIDKVYLDEDRSTVLVGTKIKELSDTSNNIKLDKVLDIAVDDAILRYLGYGITDVEACVGELEYEDDNNDLRTHPYKYVGTYNVSGAQTGAPTARKCYINVREQDGKQVIDGVWCADGGNVEQITATPVNDLNSRIDTIMDYLALPDIIDIDPVQPIITYVAYGVTSVEKAAEGLQDASGKAYAYTGEFTPVGSDTSVPCYISVKSEGGAAEGKAYVDKVWYYDGEGVLRYVFGTKVNGVADRIEGIKRDMALGEIINITENDEKILISLKDTKVGELNERISSLTVSEIFKEEDIENSPMLKQLRHVKITELATEIDNLLIQRMYSKEVYGLPADGDPMEVVNFVEGVKYYTVREVVEQISDGQGGTVTQTVKKFLPVNGDGVVSAADFGNRGKTEYFTYGKTTLDVDPATDKIKIVGFRENWLYYEKNAEDDFVLTTINVPEGAGETLTDDMTGRVFEGQFEEGKYYSYGEVYGMWRLILYKRINVGGSGTEFVEKGYSVNNFNNMVAICADNVNKSTLFELQEAGVLNETLNLDVNFYGTTDKLGDMTLEQLVEAVISLSAGSSGGTGA